MYYVEQNMWTITNNLYNFRVLCLFMKENEEIIAIITKKEDINKIVSKLKGYSFSNLKKKEHYYYSIYQKNTDEQKLADIFVEFERIDMIMERKRKDGICNYDIFYKMDDGSYILYAVNFDTTPPTMINAYSVERNYEQFKKYIIKRYWQQMI